MNIRSRSFWTASALTVALVACSEDLAFNPRLGAVQITPTTLSLLVDQVQQLVVDVRTAHGVAVTEGISLTYISTDLTVVTVTPTGMVTAENAGTAEILTTATVAASGLTVGPVGVPVSVNAVAADSIVVTPATQTVNPGQSAQLNAEVWFGTVLDPTALVGWTTGNAGVATVSNTGLVTGVQPGVVAIVGTSAGAKDTTLVNVSGPPLVIDSVTVTPQNPSVAVGATQQLSASVWIGGSVDPTAAVSWTSSNTTRATVNSSGLMTGRGVGAVTIFASSGGRNGSTNATITSPPGPTVATVQVSPSTLTLTAGQSTTLSATLRDAGGNIITGPAVAWSTSLPNIATVGQSTGVVGAVAPGGVQITATASGKSGNASITVATPGSQICEAIGGTCYYVSTTGNNISNASFANPVLNYLGLPSLKAGDFVYYRGGTYTAPAGQLHVLLHNANVQGASSGARVTYKAYPGEDVVFDGQTNGAGSGTNFVIRLGSNGAVIDGFEIKDFFGSGVNIDGTHYHEIRNNWIHDMQSSGSGTGGGIQIFSASNVNVHHNTFSDNRVFTSTKTNSAGVMLADGGANTKVHHNVFFTTVDNGQRDIYNKHSPETGRVEIYNNLFLDSPAFFYGTPGAYRSTRSGMGTDFHHNIAMGAGAIDFGNFVSPSEPSDNVIQYNTIISTARFIVAQTEESGENNRFEHNIVYQNYSGASSHTLVIHFRGTQTDWNNFAATYHFQNNRWFNAGSGGLGFAFYGGGTVSSPQAQVYTSFAAWQQSGLANANTGVAYGFNSVSGNPQFINADGTINGDYRSAIDTTRGAYAGPVGQRMPVDLTTLGRQR